MRKCLLFLLSCCLLLSGCVFRAVNPPGMSARVYRVCTDASRPGGLTAEELPLLEGESEREAIVRGLNAPSQDDSLERAFPDGVTVLDCRISGGRASVTLSPDYGSLVGVERVLADYAVTCSLEQLDEVVFVDLYCGDRLVAQGLSSSDVEICNTGYEDTGRIIKLFLPDREERCLRSRTAIVSAAEGKTLPELAIQALLEELDFLPESTALRSVSCEDGLCVVNLSEELYTTEPEHADSARLVLGSFVNTLCCLPQVERVVLRVEGAPMISYGSYIPVWPMHYDENLVRYGG